MRWVLLLLVWIAGEGVGYYGLRRLRLWRRWMGWITPGALGVFLLLWGLTTLVVRDMRGKLVLSELGGMVFWLWLTLVLIKLMSGAWGVGAAAAEWFRTRWRRTFSASGVGDADPLDSSAEASFIMGRRQFLVGVAEATALLPAGIMAYGLVRGRYRFEVEEIELGFPHLPRAFEGLRLVQFSDLHGGSFYFRPERLEAAWNLMERLRPDILCFTGDWVNVYAEELEPLVGALRQLSAQAGKWAVSGNHDYGDYARWKNPGDKFINRQHLRNLVEAAGFQVLENASSALRVGGETIYLVGTGNWGYWNRRQRYGDIEKAWAGIPEGAFVILLTHDPTHWEYRVEGRYPAALTLCGHTHGLQVGLPVGSRCWSPAGWLYRHWAGLYAGMPMKTGGESFFPYLYVNRGLGYIGLPARFGVWPEITVIRLRRSVGG